MSEKNESPLFSWDEDEANDTAQDFLSNVEAQDVPLACSIDNPECEACQ